MKSPSVLSLKDRCYILRSFMIPSRSIALVMRRDCTIVRIPGGASILVVTLKMQGFAARGLILHGNAQTSVETGTLK